MGTDGRIGKGWKQHRNGRKLTFYWRLEMHAPSAILSFHYVSRHPSKSHNAACFSLDLGLAVPLTFHEC